ncbi:hypothetical protein UNDKW_0068 [Undibacterium sp. KW1]|uniref:hypothetical protein n=1 Tax=Undibacterium sp. KW1 TaxID=2058624 RepID=UPI001331E706|nr:hypothetical protein [Undibacterium sp. KW1]BBB58341.1 hypothetical protein UNDKW_0068 [Undibacterium sp. KW1]
MDEHRFFALLGGQVPSYQDYADFISVIENLQIEGLWEILVNAPSLNGILRTAVNKTLQDKVVRKNVDESLDAIVARIHQDFK